MLAQILQIVRIAAQLAAHITRMVAPRLLLLLDHQGGEGRPLLRGHVDPLQGGQRPDGGHNIPRAAVAQDDFQKPLDHALAVFFLDRIPLEQLAVAAHVMRVQKQFPYPFESFFPPIG